MLLQEVYNILAEKTGLDSSSTNDKTKMKRVLEATLKKMYKKCKKIALMDNSYFTTTDGTYLYYLDNRVLHPTNFRLYIDDPETKTSLTITPLEKYRQSTPYTDSSDTGTPNKIVKVKKVWCTAQPTAASALSVASDSASDVTSYFVAVRGIVSGVEKQERVTLNGATPVNTTNSYTSVTSITKDATNGNVTVTSNSAAVTNIVLLPNQTEKCHYQVLLDKTPDDTYTISYDFSIIPWYFTNDEDLIPIEDMYSDNLIDISEGYLLKQQGNPNWTSILQLAISDFDMAIEDTYFSEDEDARAGLIEISDGQYGDNWNE